MGDEKGHTIRVTWSFPVQLPWFHTGLGCVVNVVTRTRSGYGPIEPGSGASATKREVGSRGGRLTPLVSLIGLSLVTSLILGAIHYRCV